MTKSQIENIRRRAKYLMRRRRSLLVTFLVGYVGSLLLAFCGLPQALQSLSQGHSEGVSPVFLAMWGAGEVFTIIYVLRSREKLDWPLLVNYTLNLTFIGIIGWYMII